MTKRRDNSNAKKRRIPLDFESAAMKAIDQIVEHEYRQKYEKEDRLAIFECVHFCDTFERPLPNWAMSALTQAVARSVERDWDSGCKALRRTLFPVPSKGGPHSNPLEARQDRDTRNLVYAAIDVVKWAGYRGKEGHEMVQKVLARRRLDRGIATIRTEWTHRRDEDRVPPGLRLSVLAALLELSKEGKAAPLATNMIKLLVE